MASGATRERILEIGNGSAHVVDDFDNGEPFLLSEAVLQSQDRRATEESHQAKLFPDGAASRRHAGARSSRQRG
jgi:hypothetical protein